MSHQLAYSSRKYQKRRGILTWKADDITTAASVQILPGVPPEKMLSIVTLGSKWSGRGAHA
ncbi:hypothetical protein HYFRA_00012039 [Hymenoscyphus fraxineus]|uniref:Uncharacterized protein n=1 Tax=Hymenoscyphus fraxineus TaxID=746836 RepID=A0A9N9PQT5_9HELO|nr:hypothetical protein HYFRA_00012039 [Hymenoscyphus fraxineus]